MSFILDALKKSETERQSQGSAEFAGVPTSRESEGAPRWLWILGLLLAINLAVLLGLWLRPDTAPQIVRSPVEASPSTAAGATDPETAEANFLDRVAEARQNAPVPMPANEETRAEPRPEAAPQIREPVVVREPPRAATNVAALPTFHEVVANGTLELPDLHLDIHVYSEASDDRFVFINMSKQRERSRLSEGPVVDEITPNGVVLSYQGTSFLLLRD